MQSDKHTTTQASSTTHFLTLALLQAEAFVRERLGRVVTVNGATGPITTFIIEPFVPHTEEYYLCIQVSPRYNGRRKKVVAGRFMCLSAWHLQRVHHVLR